MFRTAFCLLRVVLPLWVGAAVLFAINGAAEQRVPEFDSIMRARLALLRFPAYYEFGFTCVGLAIILTGISLLGSTNPRKRLLCVMALLTIVLSLMLWDFFYVYSALHDMLLPLGAAKPSTWVRLHATSMITNLIHVSMCLVASLVLCWPRKCDIPIGNVAAVANEA